MIYYECDILYECEWNAQKLAYLSGESPETGESILLISVAIFYKQTTTTVHPSIE